MNRESNREPAAARALWLAELSDALDEARLLVKRMGADEGRVEAAELHARIESVSFEIQAMRVMQGEHRRNFAPEWTGNLPWEPTA